MAIRRLGGGWQVDASYRGKRAPRVTVATKEEAQRLEAEYKAALIAGRPIVTPSQEAAQAADPGKRGGTLGDLVKLVQRTRWAGSKSEETAVLNANLICEAIGMDKSPADVTQADIDRAVATLRDKGNSPATINRKLAALSVLMNYAYEWEWTPRKLTIRKFKENEGRIRWLTDLEEAQILQLLDQWDMTEVRDWVVVALDTGFRSSEILRLTPEDYDYAERRVTAWETKGGRPRSIPCTARVTEVLTRRSQGKGRGERLFSINNDRVVRTWHRLAKVMGLENDEEFVPYCLRHTCASRLVMRGVHLLTVKEWLGHSSITTTMRYAHLAPGALREAAAVLEK